MKRISLVALLAATLSLLATAGSAFAGTVTWYDEPPGQLMSEGDVVTSAAISGGKQLAWVWTGAATGTPECRLSGPTGFEFDWTSCEPLQNMATAGGFQAFAPTSYMDQGDGTYELEVRLSFSDTPSNVQINMHYVLDETAPVVTATTPTGWTSDATPQVAYAVTDANPSATTGCAVDPVDPNNAGSYSDCPASPFALSTLGDGAHEFWVRHADKAGNVGTAHHAFSVDATAPLITVAGLGQGQTLKTAAPGISVSASDGSGSGLASLTCSLDSAAAVACESQGITAASFANGKHAITATATDAVGNVSAQTVSFSVNATLAPPRRGTFKLRRGKLSRGKYAAKASVVFAIPAGGSASSCGGKAQVRLSLGKKRVASGSVKWKAAGGKCTATSALKIAKKYKGKKLKLTLKYSSGPIKAFSISKTLKF